MSVPSSDHPPQKVLSRVLVLVGPTASGKTSVSLDLARNLDAEILSADSRQIFRHMDIGTAKPSPEERRAVRHYFVDELSPDEEFNAGEFGRKGREIINEILSRGKTPLVVGGSGLYIRALIDGFFEGPSADPDLRRELYALLHERGQEHLYEMLRDVDPISAGKMIPANTRRIIRALEVFRLTGMPISSLHEQKTEIAFTPVFAGLEWDRKELYGRINRRVDMMIEAGLVDEVKKLVTVGFRSDLNAFQTVGYKEIFEHVEGRLSLEEAIELIKRNSRRYAKRQLTWFRPDTRIHWHHIAGEDDLMRISESILRDFQGNASLPFLPS